MKHSINTGRRDVSMACLAGSRPGEWSLQRCPPLGRGGWPWDTCLGVALDGGECKCACHDPAPSHAEMPARAFRQRAASTAFAFLAGFSIGVATVGIISIVIDMLVG